MANTVTPQAGVVRAAIDRAPRPAMLAAMNEERRKETGRTGAEGGVPVRETPICRALAPQPPGPRL